MILNVKKPKGITSHDVVDRVRDITKERRVGHAGTLDPFATGVLVIAVGREDTKKLGSLTKNTEKEYVAILKLGEISSTGDPEGEITRGKDPSSLTEKQVEAVLKEFAGTISQTPPSTSAIKIQGKPAYKRTRRGETVDMPKRTVIIFDIKLLNFSLPFINIQVTCSPGTYIRTLAKDIGEELGVGAYVTELKRTRVGNYTIEQAVSLEELPAFLKE